MLRLSPALFPDFANLHCLCAGGEDVVDEVTGGGRVCVAATAMSPVCSVHLTAPSW